MNWFSKIHELAGQEYERYLPTAFDGSLTLLEKVNKVIETLNQVVLGVNTVADYVDGHVDTQNEKIKQLRDDFEILKDWLENEGLEERTAQVLNEWFDNGRLAQIINNDVFNMKTDKATFEQFVHSTSEQLAQKASQTSTLSSLKRNVPLVGIVDDDGNRAVLSKLQPISERHGVPFTIALVGKEIDNADTVTGAEALDLQDRLGWEIASHSQNHLGFSGITNKQMEIEAKQSKESLQKHGLNVTTFVYPGGQAPLDGQQIVSNYYNSGVSTAAVINYPPYRTFYLGRLEFPQPAPNNTLAYYKSKVDEAIANNGWLIFMTHVGQSTMTEAQLEILEDLIVYIKSRSVDIVTIQEGLNISGNPLSLRGGDEVFNIGSDGTNNIVNYMYRSKDILTGLEHVNFDTKPNQLTLNKTHVSSITSQTNRTKSPSQLPGLLILNIPGEGELFNASRIFIDSENKMYTSNATASGGDWFGWKRMLSTSGSKISTRPDVTIPAKGFVRFALTQDPVNYSLGQYAIVNPSKPLPQGLLVSYYHRLNMGGIEVQLYNTTDQPIELIAYEWRYIIMDV